jgi:hypothetical protein
MADEQTSSDARRLRADYRGAFSEWVMQVSRLQGLETSGVGYAELTEAGKQADAAELKYRGSRDRLADDMDHPE